MKNAWKVILIIAAVLLGLGIIAGAAGLLTGASPDRMIEVVFGGREALELLISVLKDELASIF